MSAKPILLSASRGAAILGLNKYQTPFHVWQIIQEEISPGFNSLHGYVFPEEPDNAAIRWGRAFEDTIIRLAADMAGKEIINREEYFGTNGESFSSKSWLKSEGHFITCHIDGQYAATVLHEGKTTTEQCFRESWGEPGTDHVPRIYQIQCQHQMLCTGSNEVILSVLVFPKSPEEWEKMGRGIEFEGKDNIAYIVHNQKVFWNLADNWACILMQMGYFHQFTIKRSPELIAKILEKYSYFWNENILKSIPPEPINIDDIKRLSPEPAGTIIIDDWMIPVFDELRMITKEISPTGLAAKRKEQLKTIILDAAVKRNKIIDTDSTDKFIFVDTQGKKLGQWGKDKNGNFIFR